jgi:hypothetical protein
MVTKDRLVIYCGLAGWATMTLWMVICYLYSPANSYSALSRLNLADSPLSILFLTVSFALFSASAYFSYDFWLNKTGTSDKIIKFAPIVFIALTFICAPLNTHDITYYFGAGVALNEGNNIYVQNWTMKNYFFTPPLEGSSIGIMYGPLVLLLFKGMHYLSGGNIVAFILSWKALVLLCLVLCFALSQKIIRLCGKNIEKNKFYLFWFSQPLLLWVWLGNGQFDALWLVFVFLAILFATRRTWWLVIVCLIIGAWIKFIPLIMAPWFALWWWQDTNKSNWKKNILNAIFGVVVSVVVTFFSWLAFWRGPEVFQSIILQSKWAVSSIFSAVYYSLKPSFVIIFADNAHWYLTRLVHLLIFTAVIYLAYPVIINVLKIIWKKMQWQTGDYILAIFLSMLIYISVWQKSFWPWYVSWLLPIGIILLPIFENRYLKKIVVWLSIAPLYFFVIWTINYVLRGTDAAPELWFNYAIVLLVWAYPLFLLVKWRRDRYIVNRNRDNGIDDNSSTHAPSLTPIDTQ